jgi:hypothetical protein
MHAIVFIGLLLLLLFDIVSTAREVFRWRAAVSDFQVKTVVRRRIAIHLGVYALLIVVVLAIVYFGPLRPVHEWIK